jgi:hypothetical protein
MLAKGRILKPHEPIEIDTPFIFENGDIALHAAASGIGVWMFLHVGRDKLAVQAVGRLVSHGQQVQVRPGDGVTGGPCLDQRGAHSRRPVAATGRPAACRQRPVR